MLQISERLLIKIAQWCKEGYPSEVCGILLGTTKQETHTVREIFPAKNINEERKEDRYELGPKDFMKADQFAREGRLDIIGFYHSHPDHPAQASQTDTERAWEGYSYLILSVQKGGLDSFRSWRLNKDRMIEERVEAIHGQS